MGKRDYWVFHLLIQLFDQLFYNSVEAEFKLQIFFSVKMEINSVQWNRKPQKLLFMALLDINQFCIYPSNLLLTSPINTQLLKCALNQFSLITDTFVLYLPKSHDFIFLKIKLYQYEDKDPKSFQIERKGLPTKERESGQHR